MATQIAERRGLAYSAAMHGILLLLFIIGLPSFFMPDPIEEPTAITVDILPISAISNVKPTKKAPKKEKKKKEDKPKPAEITEKVLDELKAEKEKPSPLTKTDSAEPTPPKTEEKAEALEEEKPKDKPKDKPKEEDPLDAILKSVKKESATNKKKAEPSEDTSESSNSGNRSNKFDPSSPEALAIRDAIQSQVYRCWNVPAGARNAESLIVPLEIDYDKGGNPVKVNLAKSVSGQYRSDPFFRAAADSAIRAVHRCAPLQGLPLDSYNIWQYVDMNFNPKEMLF